jgi:hypothetical protein|tara:strand:- start:107 stop:931 length:825 start_codon:yes stop_codon:yes gene_type:complete
MEEYLVLARAKYPNIPDDILNAIATQWAETGDPKIAIANVRQTQLYKDTFPGNTLPNGQVRYNEVTYQGLKESYIGTLAEFGLPRATSTELLSSRFVDLIEGEVSAREFEQRITAVYRGIKENITEVQSFYETNYGIDLGAEAIFLGALDPTVGEEIIAGRITTAQIGGEAAKAGFTISTTVAERLKGIGLTQGEARELFTAAQAELPKLQEIASRAEPTEDAITLDEFTEAAMFGDVEVTERIKRLKASEESIFSPVGGAARQGSRVTGLTEQ